MPSSERPAGLGPYLALLAGAVCIGFSAILVRLSDVGPVASGFWRLALAAPLLLGTAWLQGRRSGGAWPAPTGGSLALGVLFACDLGCWHWGIRFTSIANASLLAGFSVLFVGAYAWLAWKQRQGLGFLLSAAAALGGMCLLTGGDGGWHPRQLRGDLLTILATLFYAAYLVVLTGARRRSAALPLIAWSSLFSALCLLPAALLSRQAMLPAGLHGWLVLAGLALVPQVCGQALITYAFAHVPPVLSTVSLLLQPVVATALAWGIFGESLTGMRLAGALLILGGIGAAKVSSSGSG